MDEAVNVLRLVTERLRTSFSIAYQLIECVTLHSFIRQLVYDLVLGARQLVGLFQHFRFKGDVLLGLREPPLYRESCCPPFSSINRRLVLRW